MRYARARFAAASLLALGMGCSLIKLQVSTPETRQQEAEERSRAREEREQEDRRREAKRAVEETEREEALVKQVDALRADIAAAKGPDKTEKVKELAKLLPRARGSKAAKEGRIDVPALSLDVAGHLEKEIAAGGSLELFDLLAALPASPEMDAAVVRACAGVRPRVPANDVPGFVAECLDRADGDAKKLNWPGVQRDLAAYKKAKEERAAAEAKAKEEQGKQARYIAGAVFASGRCNFGNCLKDGWTAPSPEGDIQVRCDFQDCFKNGWTARYPSGGEARTRCMFQDCTKDGWETTYPDGKTARTRCMFQNCLKDGWETELPGGGTARTRCSFQDCSKDGWDTDLPGGGRMQCRCNFQKCFENGASCG
jgi:hypothetical protein